ncbi:hypothetical protein [Roseivirga misakiensis]|uniref:Uncharacterized protein n=1 Tax=Roseivirga misakiensis TaxID=1563681 RepID=A0A1E5T6S8_9BACT|nr:hypothetical protein [Roseivirga misakiensis]OEK07007.1 hypothetical protein BFP71_04935 [Roseivirga misakiensis]
MKKKKISWTNSFLHAFEIGFVFSMALAHFELAENFPERLNDNFWQDIRAIIDYWFGWVIGSIWIYLLAFTVVMGVIIHGIKHLWRRVFDFPK